MTAIADGRRPGLSGELREQTRIAHTRAETAPYVQQLLGGALPLSAYTALVAQNHAVYQALERAADRWRDDPVAGPFVLDELTRLPHLEADLAQLLGRRWRAKAEQLRLPATERYVERLTEVAGGWAGGFVAHHYVRYLGDLSGGQIIKADIARIYGDDGRRSTGFYTFGGIAKIKTFRDRYRTLLDDAPFTPAEQRAVIAEAVVAFDLNRAVFADLSAEGAPDAGSARSAARRGPS